MSQADFRKSPGASLDCMANVETSLPACFDIVARLHPGVVALGSGAWRPTYQELKDAANGMAHTLLARGGSPGDRVAVLMQHDTPLIAAVLAALKAGRIVVVLNPTEPAVRLGQVLADAEPCEIMTDLANENLAAQIAENRCGIVCIDNLTLCGASASPDVRIGPDDVAFLVYTSGTTGRPKGVMQTHGHILHKAIRLSKNLDIRKDDRMTLLGPLSSGQGVTSTWVALMNGITLCPFPTVTKGVTGLADWMEAHGITIYCSAASVFRSFMATLDPGKRFRHVRYAWLASESSTSNDFQSFARHFAGDAQLIHTLSSSETGPVALARFSANERVAEGHLHVGRPLEGIEVLLLGDDGRSVACGEAGEITVRSRYLSPGYWRNEFLTKQLFSGGSELDAVRIFRGGDRGRLTADGLLMFVGREDFRVKIHGYRVELSEIDEALARVSGVNRAVVCAQDRPGGDPQLVAYVTAQSGHTISANALRHALSAELPGYMIPTAYVFLESFPLTPNGKIDRAKLRQLAAPVPMLPDVERPVTKTEADLADIWKAVFGHDGIGRDADFFHLGGDSLMAAVVSAKVHAALHVELSLQIFSEHSKLAALAGVIDGLRNASGAERLPPLLPAPRDAPMPLSLAQERIWRYSRTPESSAGYVKATSMRISGPLEVYVFRWSVEQVIRRHEILRTTFEEKNGAPVQIVHPSGPLELPLIDLSTTPDPITAAATLLRQKAREPFDLSLRPLLRMWLVQIRADEHLLLRVNHIIIADGLSLVVFYRDLGLIYESRLRGGPAPCLDELRLQYGDFAAWQRLCLRPDGKFYKDQIAWWESILRSQPPPMKLPFLRPVTQQDASPSDGVISWGLPADVTSILQTFARESGATFYMIRLAVFSALLAIETGGHEILIGTHGTNRTRLELQEMFGFFLNMVPLRFHFSEELTFRDWLGCVKKVVAEAQSHAEIPFEQLCEELRRRGVAPPDIQVIFGLSGHTPVVRFGGLEIVACERTTETMPWGFSLSFDIQDEASFCRATFNARIYDPARVRDFIGRLVRLLEAASRKPGQSMASLLRDSSSANSHEATSVIMTPKVYPVRPDDSQLRRLVLNKNLVD